MNTELFKKFVWLWMALLLPLGFVACSNDDEEPLEDIPEVIPPAEEDDPYLTEEGYYNVVEPYINQFCYEEMSYWYLWWDKVDVSNWYVLDNPMEKVKEIRYEEDRWTSPVENIKAYTEPPKNTSGTYGYELSYLVDGKDTSKVIGVLVLMVYPESPAAKAGLKRGSIILKVNGKDIQYTNEEYNTLRSSASLDLTVYDPETKATEEVKMASTSMYLDPVLFEKVFDCGGKKVGYLYFAEFSIDCGDRLIEVAKKFKQEGVKELILDLRYNRGGYVYIEELLAALLGPMESVKAGELYQTTMYNDSPYGKDLEEYYGKDFSNVYFKVKHEWALKDRSYSYDVSDANIGLDKIYALVTGNSASASESILVGLFPFMDIDVIGTKTYGKHCTGMYLEAKDYYEDWENILDELKKTDKNAYQELVDDFWKYYAGWRNYVADWGMYVMINTYADKFGNNPCRPDGIKPDVEVQDYPVDPYPLGDDREALLREALTRAGYTDFTPLPEKMASRSVTSSLSSELIPRKTVEGRILLKPELPMKNIPDLRLKMK